MSQVPTDEASPIQTAAAAPEPGYAVAPVRAAIAALRALVPTITSVRIDKVFAGPLSRESPPRGVIEHGRGQVLKLGLWADDRRARDHAATALRLDAASAGEVLNQLRRLRQLNAHGAWATMTSDVPALEVSTAAVGTRALDRDTYLGTTCHYLAQDFPHVGAIEVDYQITASHQPGKSRRRAFLRFVSQDGSREVCALDSSGFALHARHQLLDVDHDAGAVRRLNLERMECWSAQLATSPEWLAESFGTFAFLTSALHVTRIRLR